MGILSFTCFITNEASLSDAGSSSDSNTNKNYYVVQSLLLFLLYPLTSSTLYLNANKQTSAYTLVSLIFFFVFDDKHGESLPDYCYGIRICDFSQLKTSFPNPYRMIRMQVYIRLSRELRLYRVNELLRWQEAVRNRLYRDLPVCIPELKISNKVYRNILCILVLRA